MPGEKKKDKGKAELKSKEPSKDKEKKPKKKVVPSEFVLGARVEVVSHEVDSMILKRGLCLGTSSVTKTPRKRLMVAVKLEAPMKKGSVVDTSSISRVPYQRQASVCTSNQRDKLLIDMPILSPRCQQPTAEFFRED